MDEKGSIIQGSVPGIVSGIFTSYNKNFYRGITHQDNKFLRWAIIESVWYAGKMIEKFVFCIID